MARIPSATLETIRGRIDLVRLVEESGVQLRQRGSRYAGLCPFHQDSDPSFSVSQEKGLFHCFGCGKSGTAFTYLMLRESLSFEESVRKLADRAGVSLKGIERSGPTDEALRMAKANLKAQSLFHRWLKESARAQEYLESRGVLPETIDDLQLGYAPDSWDSLMSEMKSAGYEVDFLVKAGLVRENDKGRRYDYFRNRVIFPICDLNGETAGFGGRALEDDSGPKYLNSPETPLYQKSQILYMMDRAHSVMREEGRAVIAEGYMDVIAMRQAGILNAVAPLGSALSKYHARLIKRRCDSVALVLDGDDAGARAAERGAGAFLEEGLRVEAAALPAGQDPDDVIQNQGAEAFQELLKGAVPVVEFMISRLAQSLDMSTPEAKLQAVEKAAELMRRVPSAIMLRDHASRLAKELDLPKQVVWEELRRLRVRVGSAPEESPRMHVQIGSARIRLERELLGLLAANPERIPAAFDRISPNDFQQDSHQELAKILWEASRGGEDDAMALVDACYDDEARELLSGLLIDARPLSNVEGAVEGAIGKMEQDSLRRMEYERLEEMERGGADDLEIAKLLTELSEQRRQTRRQKRGDQNRTL